MTKNRIKPATVSREEALAAIDRAAMLQTRKRILEGKRDKRIQSVQDEYGQQLAPLADEIAACARQAESYADTHREELFPAGKKSAETPMAVFGYRLSTPALKPLNKAWTWGDILEGLKKSPVWKTFVRTKEEIDKDGLKKKATDADLASLGMRVSQSESFFIEPKLDEPSAGAIIQPE